MRRFSAEAWNAEAGRSRAHPLHCSLIVAALYLEIKCASVALNSTGRHYWSERGFDDIFRLLLGLLTSALIPPRFALLMVLQRLGPFPSARRSHPVADHRALVIHHFSSSITLLL